MKKLISFLAVLVFNTMALLPSTGEGQAKPVPAFYGKSYAVIVGIGRYPSEKWPNLAYARKDAEGMASVLRGQGFEIITLYDRKATREAIISTFEDYLAPRLRKNDRVLVFFSGHGDTQTLGGRDYGYLVPYNAGKTYGSLISMETLRSLSEKMGSAKHQLFVIDACFGGLFAPTKAAVAGIPRSHPRYVREITRRTARQFITAGGKGQQVLDGGPNGYSYFTGYLLDALGKGLGDLDGDGYITLSELAGYLVPKATNEYQTPGTGTLPGHGLGDFLFMAPGAQKTSSTVPLVQQEQALGLKGRSGTAQQETLFWQSIKESRMPEDYSAYLEAFPNGLFAGLARNRIRQLGGADADSRLTNVARGNPPTERPTNIRKTPNFAEFYKENSNRVLLELNHFLSTKYSTGGRSLNVSQIWKHRVAEKELPKGGKSGTWIWMSFDVQQGPRNVSSQEGYFLLEVRGDALLVHDAQGLEF